MFTAGIDPYRMANGSFKGLGSAAGLMLGGHAVRALDDGRVSVARITKAIKFARDGIAALVVKMKADGLSETDIDEFETAFQIRFDEELRAVSAIFHGAKQ